MADKAGVEVVTLEAYEKLSKRLAEIEKMLDWLKSLPAIAQELAKPHTCEMVLQRDIESHIRTKICTHPLCQRREVCGTEDNPHQFTVRIDGWEHCHRCWYYR